jgi:signal peptidase II
MLKNRFFWLVAILSPILDRVTKNWVVDSFKHPCNIWPFCEQPCNTWPLWKNVFHFTYVVNPGAAFSFFSNAKDNCIYPGEEAGAWWLRWLSLIVSLGLMAYAWWGPKLSAIEQLGWGFVFAGAFGNGIDRFLSGYVIDFLDFRLINFPVFNLADVSINIGIGLLLIASFREAKK